LAEKLRASIPRMRAESRTMTPRTSGSLKNGVFSEKKDNPFFFTTISPSGLRTATAIDWGDLIMTPSITACPPTLRGGFRFEEIA
jgi:hypothetical protein